MPTAIASTGVAGASVSVQAAEADAFDRALISRIADRDQLAMRALFARHRTPVYRWLVRLVEEPARAEDLLSEVFLDVWRQAATFAGRSAVSTWLLAIARYKALSALRRRREDQLDLQAAEDIGDPADDAEALIDEKDRSERLAQALWQLSDGHRAVIDLVYYHGKSVSDVAAIMGIPASMVKTRMFYARRKLAELVNVR